MIEDMAMLGEETLLRVLWLFGWAMNLNSVLLVCGWAMNLNSVILVCVWAQVEEYHFIVLIKEHVLPFFFGPFIIEACLWAPMLPVLKERIKETWFFSVTEY